VRSSLAYIRCKLSGKAEGALSEWLDSQGLELCREAADASRIVVTEPGKVGILAILQPSSIPAPAQLKCF
jgi:hypothetical protein